MAHVKPKNRRTWDVRGEVGYSIGTSMEHHRCFNVYIVKTRATRVSDSVFLKHQYITNPQITPETLVMKAAAELTSALKDTVLQEAKTADALAKVSELFQKIAASKAESAKTKEQRNQHRTHPSSRQAVPIPRVENKSPARQAVPIPRVQATPNYISQDEDQYKPRGYNTRSRTKSITQEAMLAGINIAKEVSAQEMAGRSNPTTWPCEMANSVMGDNGELLEYRHLVANPKTRATWSHWYGN
jgi:hypothetical protein